jgi:hypothetical protein
MMNEKDIVEELGQDILAYVMSGSRAETEIAQRIKPEDLSDRFVDYQLLLDLHFVLRSDVVDFVEKLSQRLRRIKTSTEVNRKTQRGGIEDSINWGETIKQRYSQNPRDRSIFVCDNKTVNYDIPENVVLVHLVSVINKCLQDSKEFLRNDYTWNEKSWKGEKQLIDRLERIVERNVHIDRIRSPEYYEPTEKMLISAESSRQPLYKDAAELVRKRRQIQEGDQREMAKLLENTAITPDDQSTLFELYVLFRFIETLEDIRNEAVRLKTIRPDQNEIARFESDPETVLYHNQSAGDRGISFELDESFEEQDNLSRSDRVQKMAKEFSDNYFAEGVSNYTGRPDILVLEINNDKRNEYEYLITEVKNTTNKDTIKRGIRETLEYLAFLQVEKAGEDDSEYVHPNSEEKLSGSKCKGLLVVRDLDRETQDFDDQSSEMKVLQASTLRENLDTVIEEAFNDFD